MQIFDMKRQLLLMSLIIFGLNGSQAEDSELDRIVDEIMCSRITDYDCVNWNVTLKEGANRSLLFDRLATCKSELIEKIDTHRSWIYGYGAAAVACLGGSLLGYWFDKWGAENVISALVPATLALKQSVDINSKKHAVEKLIKNINTAFPKQYMSIMQQSEWEKILNQNNELTSFASRAENSVMSPKELEAMESTLNEGTNRRAVISRIYGKYMSDKVLSDTYKSRAKKWLVGSAVSLIVGSSLWCLGKFGYLSPSSKDFGIFAVLLSATGYYTSQILKSTGNVKCNDEILKRNLGLLAPNTEPIVSPEVEKELKIMINHAN